MKKTAWAGLSTLLLVCGCAPMTPVAPFHFLETARPAGKGRLELSGALGAGGLQGQGDGGGLRARYGLTKSQDLGLEVLTVNIKNNDKPTPIRPWLGNSTLSAGKLSWKWAFEDGAALIAGLSGNQSSTGDAWGADLACVASTPEEFWGFLRPYLGVRGGVGVPLGRGSHEAGGISYGTNLAFGTEMNATERWRFHLEIGSLHAWHSGYLATALDANRQIQDLEHVGNYIALGTTYLWDLNSKSSAD